MSLFRAARPVGALFHVALAESLVYRARLVVWVLASTTPFVMLALLTAATRTAPLGRFGQREFVGYYLATFLVRQMTGSWAAWDVNADVRSGALAAKLLRPIHPLWGYACENLAVLPIRVATALPLSIAGLMASDTAPRAGDVPAWLLVAISLLGGWLMSFFVSFSIGCLSFYSKSSVGLIEGWTLIGSIFSGYVLPVELFPRSLRAVADWLPFRYQVGLPVELLTSSYDRGTALGMVLRQWGFVAGSCGAAMLLWRSGVRRFAAHGG